MVLEVLIAYTGITAIIPKADRAFVTVSSSPTPFTGLL